MVNEAHLERVASGLAPVTPGWFVVNTAEAAWVTNDDYCGGVCIFEADDFVLRGRPDLPEYIKPHAGFTIRVVPAGRPSGLYHAESVQEDFLILSGECILIIEDEERHLRTWDFVHCPPMTAHTFVATDGPCVILATGNRRGQSGAHLSTLRGRPSPRGGVGGHNGQPRAPRAMGGWTAEGLGRPSLGRPPLGDSPRCCGVDGRCRSTVG